MKDWLIVVPARLGSTRLPKKPLVDLAGKPLIVRVVENLTNLIHRGAEVVVATDSADIIQVCKSANIAVQMTRLDHHSGTDRCLEVANATPKKFVMNVQGDEPFICLTALEGLADFVESGRYEMATLAYCNRHKDAFESSNIVKIALCENTKRALYFSRSPIPNRTRYIYDDHLFGFWQHIGVYAYKIETLRKFCSFSPSLLEQMESLEQLRALENGIEIGVVYSEKPSIGIDTFEDLEKARERLAKAEKIV
ncbi:MAG: 3-deoxy-manno-octulosonate cytidylyltransferase [Bdellovibrionota bacterium]